jgi:hypothetical protein
MTSGHCGVCRYRYDALKEVAIDFALIDLEKVPRHQIYGFATPYAFVARMKIYYMSGKIRRTTMFLS